MKTKLLMTALALPLVFGACTNEEILPATESMTQNGDMVEVGPNFVIAGVKGNDAMSRAQWVKDDNLLNFLWIPKNDGGNAILDRIGICWLGNGGVSDNVYTNYEFIHNGWLAKDEMSAEVDPCYGYIKNGYNFYNVSYDGNSLKNEDSGANSDNVDVTTSSITDGKYVNITATTENNSTTATAYNLASAFFRTSAQTLFKGDYIAYSPFNADFVEEGPIVATSPVTFDVDMTAGQEFAHLGDAMFAYGYAPGLVGGQMASAFNFKNLSGLVRVRLSGELTGVSSVALYDESGKFISSVGLSAQKIMNEGATSTGTALYVAGTAEYTNMLTAEVTGLSAGNDKDVFFSALPTTTGALKVILYNGTTNKSAVYDAEAITVTPGALASIEVASVKAADFTKRIATSEAALKAMVGDNETVTLLGDIKLSASWNLGKKATIEGGKIIVPANKASQIVWTIENDATIKSDIEIENAGCCDVNSGKLELGVNTGADITLAGTIENYGEIETVVASNATDKNTITVTGKLNNHAEYISEKDETLYGKVTVAEKSTVELNADLQNDGEIIIKAIGKTNEDGTLNVASGVTVTNNHEMTNSGNINNRGNINNTENGWFIDKIGSQVGIKQITTGKGEYVCEVNGQVRLSDALGANYDGIVTRVRFVNNNAFTSEEEEEEEEVTDGKYDFLNLPQDNSDIDFEVAMTTASDKVTFTSSADAKKAHELKIGKLYVTSGNFTVEYQGKDSDGNKEGITKFYTQGIEVDGADAQNVDLQVDTDVNGDVNLVQMANKLTIGTVETVETVGSKPVVSVTDVHGNFIVGAATTKAAVSFLNCNTTNIDGNFTLNKEGTCTIEVATAPSSDIYAARVWAADVIENGGAWGNSSTVKIK